MRLCIVFSLPYFVALNTFFLFLESTYIRAHISDYFTIYLVLKELDTDSVISYLKKIIVFL